MEQFYSISSQHDSPQAVIEDCLQQLQAIPPEANFGFVYATDSMVSHYTQLVQQCVNNTGIKHWVGSLGLGVITAHREMYDTAAVSIMLAEFDAQEFSIVPLIRKTEELSISVKTPRPFDMHFGVIHGDPFNTQTQELIQGLQQQLENAFLVGGLTSAIDEHLQLADVVVSGGISGVLFSENIGVLTNLSQGCSPVGEKHRITSARENVAFSLDDEPALDVLMRDTNIHTRNELADKATEIFTGLCTSGSDISDYTVRNLIGVDHDHRVFAINDYLDEEAELIFCTRNQQTAIDDMQHMLDNLAGRLNGTTPKGAIYISCLGRGREQFGDNSEEVELIHNTLGDFPLTGFFANGEIHHDKLYGYTGVLTLFV